MEYLVWVLIALLSYSFVGPVTSVIMRDVPAAPGLFLSTVVFLGCALGVLLATDTAEASYATTPEAGLVYAGGAFLTVGILSYTAALESGPVSIVVPIFGMFIAGSSVLGVVVLDETLTLPRAAGIGCAVLAIYCSAGDGR